MSEQEAPVPIMRANSYQIACLKTAEYPRGSVNGLLYCALGLAGEAGEVANKVKKIVRDDRGALTDERRLQIIDELGDAQWYLACLATELGTFLGDVMSSNLKKLDERKQRGVIKGSGDTR